MNIQEKYEFLKEAGLSIKFLSTLTNIKTSLLYRWNNGKTTLSDDKIQAINKAIEILYEVYENTQKAKTSTPYDDLSNQKFNHLTALYPVGPNKNGYMQWACQCDCGNPILRIATGYSLKKNETVSCGCQRVLNGGKNLLDLTNKVFGKLTVIKRVENSKDNRVQWLCQCDCGNKKIVKSQHLVSGKTQSCGCITNSIGETNIEAVLKENLINYKKEFSFSDLKSPKGFLLRFDFAIFKENGELSHLIEFDGKQHLDNDILYFCNSLEEKQYRLLCDKLKDEYCYNKNIRLIRIPHTKRDNIKLEELL